MANVTVKYKGSTIAEMSEEGTKTLKTSRKYCEGDIAVNYTPPAAPSVPCKVYDITLAKSYDWVLIQTLEAEVLEHIHDPSFRVLLAISDPYAYEWYSGACYYCGNTPFSMQGDRPIYGYSNRQQTETVISMDGIYYPVDYTGTDMSIGGRGAFRIDGSKLYMKPSDGYIRGGNYRLVFTW